jgi:hypothetical protein
LGDIPSHAKRVQSGTGRGFLANQLQIFGGIEKSIRQKRHKVMKLKGFRYIAGYSLSWEARTELAGKKKTFSLFAS